MADNTWDASTDNDANTAANWSENRVPTGTDVAVFDSGTTNENCNLSGNISCQGIKFANTYTGTIDAVTHHPTLGTDGLNCTNGGSATILMGNGSTWTCNGDWNHADIGVLTYETSELVMNTNGTSIIGSSTKDLYALKISANVTLSASTASYQDLYGGLTVDESCTLTLSEMLLVRAGASTVNGTVSGSDELNMRANLTVSATGHVTPGTVTLRDITLTNNGEFAPTNVNAFTNVTVTAATYGGAWTCDATSAATAFTFGGNVTFTGAIAFDADSAGNTYTIDNSGNHSIEFQDNVTLAESAGTLAYTTDTGTIKLAGSNNQTITTPNGWTTRIDAFEVDKTAGDVTLAANSDLYPKSFTGTSTGTGEWNPGSNEVDTSGNCSWAAAFKLNTAADGMNGCTWDIGGDFTADGQTLNATATWYLEVTGTAVASGTGSVDWSDASGHTEITATGWSGDNNTNWNFGGAAAEQSILCLAGVGA